MTAPLMHKVTKRLVGRGLGVLRFNFRGVGASSGAWGGGVDEINDVAAAVQQAGREDGDLPIGIAGWSFGAVTGLAWQARDENSSPYAGIAPPIRTEYADRLPAPGSLPAAARTFILGDRDQFATVEETRTYTEAAGASLSVLSGSDHFFFFREDQVADLIADHFETSFE
jgi:alpha/beta superfamily hydrolase